MKGKFYGIGVGPGDPELITLKAIRILGTVDVVISPESAPSKKSSALEIAGRYVHGDAELISLSFPMTHDREGRERLCEAHASRIHGMLEKGKKVAFLTLGDPMLYSTYSYVLKYLLTMGDAVESVPGITSFCAIANKMNEPLAQAGETVGIIPMSENGTHLPHFMDEFDTLVVMKPSSNGPLLAQAIEDRGQQQNFFIVSQCGTGEEEVSRDLGTLREGKVHYLSTVIIKRRGFAHE
jgi:precorrin-2/cobalt-factor-2 C20-methyltransferase